MASARLRTSGSASLSTPASSSSAARGARAPALAVAATRVARSVALSWTRRSARVGGTRVCRSATKLARSTGSSRAPSARAGRAARSPVASGVARRFRRRGSRSAAAVRGRPGSRHDEGVPAHQLPDRALQRLARERHADRRRERARVSTRNEPAAPIARSTSPSGAPAASSVSSPSTMCTLTPEAEVGNRAFRRRWSGLRRGGAAEAEQAAGQQPAPPPTARTLLDWQCTASTPGCLAGPAS